MGGKSSKDDNILKKEIIQYVPEKEDIPHYEIYPKIKTQTIENEQNELLKVKRDRLKYQLWDIREKLKTIDNIYEVESLCKKDEKQLNDKDIKDEYWNCCSYEKYLYFNFNIIGLLFVIFYLVGIYQLIGLLKITQKEMMFGIQSFLFEKNRTNITENENFDIEENYKLYFFKNIPDFNLLFLTSIIGNILLKGFGLKFASFLFMLINSIIIFFFPHMNSQIINIILIKLY